MEEHEQRLTYAGQLKPGLILYFKYRLVENDNEKIKIVKKLSQNDVQFMDLKWKSIDNLLKQDVIIIGEQRKFLWIFTYNHYYEIKFR